MQEWIGLKSNFLATVSHELRTPLTSVIGYSEMLLEGLAGPLSPEQRDYVQIIMEKGDHLLTLITGLLDVSRMDTGTPTLSLEPIALPELCASILSALAPLARRKRVELRAEPAPGSPRAHADREKLRQVLFNLLSNAIKFTPEGGRVLLSIDSGTLAREDDLGSTAPWATACASASPTAASASPRSSRCASSSPSSRWIPRRRANTAAPASA
jgi:signal transduction histidine kinase